MCSCDFQKYSAALGVHGKINTLTDECVHIYTHFIIFLCGFKGHMKWRPLLCEQVQCIKLQIGSVITMACSWPCSSKRKSSKDNIVVEMKSDNTEEAILLGVNGEKQQPNDQVHIWSWTELAKSNSLSTEYQTYQYPTQTFSFVIVCSLQ